MQSIQIKMISRSAVHLILIRIQGWGDHPKRDLIATNEKKPLSDFRPLWPSLMNG